MAREHRGPDSDRLIVARISGVAMRHANWREPAGDEIAAAAAELREVAGDRPDLLAEEAGILLGFHEGGLNEPRARSAAQLLIAAGADENLIPGWIEEGRRRAGLRRHPPFSRDDSGKLQGLVITAYGSRARERRDDHQEVLARLAEAGRAAGHAASDRAAIVDAGDTPGCSTRHPPRGSLTAGTGFQLRDQLPRSPAHRLDGPDALLAGRNPA